MGSFFRACFQSTIVQTMVIVTALACIGPVRAQSPAFEVATIKPSAPDIRGATFYNPSGGRFAVANTTLKDLIALAYDVRGFQISGGPGWIDSSHYDVVAKSETPGDFDQLKPMLQSLLADRFQLVFHRTTKELPVNALVIGKNGPKLHPSQFADPDLRGRNGELTARKIRLSMLAARLADRLGRPVIDQTGLTGDFDFTLQWTPDDGKPQSDPSRPSIFTAVQEQLGLKLESQKGPVDILVVDRAERPSEN